MGLFVCGMCRVINSLTGGFIMATVQVITAKEFGKSYAILEAKVSSNDEDLARVLSKLPDYDAYIKFRTEFKEGALGAGYRESGFDMLWSRIIGRLAADFAYTVPKKPVTTEASAKVAKSREKKKAETDELLKLPEEEIKKRIDSLGKAISESAVKGEVNKAATSEATRYLKALETKRKESSKAAGEEKKQLVETLRGWLKDAPIEVLKAMEVAGRAKMQELHDAKKQADEVPLVDQPQVEKNKKRRAA
jgi:hypothetical protein